MPNINSSPDTPAETPTRPIRMRTDIKECPYCHNNIEHLNYKSSGIVEYGDASLNGNDRDVSDTDHEDIDITYTCPDCEAEVIPSELINVPEEIPEIHPEPTPPIRLTEPDRSTKEQNKEPQPHIENFHSTQFCPEGPDRYVPNRPEVPTFLKCPKCHELTEPTLSKERNDQYNHCFNGKDEIEVNCWNCGKKLNKKHKVDPNKLT